LVVPGQGIDTGAKNAVAEMQLGMLAVFAQFERAIIVERVNAGLVAAKAKGVRLGRPHSLNPHYNEVARLRSQGMSGRAIGEELGIPSSTVFKIIGQQLAAAA
jgi:DNA invertase Pin-like site-specific DNA recombinase